MHRDTLLMGGLAAVALLIEHYTFRKGEQQIGPPLTYVVGVTTLGLPYTWVCIQQERPDLAMAFWQVAGMGGTAVAAAYAWDTWRKEAIAPGR